MVKIRFTYDVVTDESAANGDTAERGWYIPGMGKFAEDDASASAHIEMRAREAVEEIQRTVGAIDSVSVYGNRATFYAADAKENYRTGESTRYAAHIVADPRLVDAIVAALEARS